MAAGVDEVRRALAGTVLGGRPVEEVPILPDEGLVACAVPCGPVDPHVAWEEARALLSATGRWPVLCSRAMAPEALQRWAFRDSEGRRKPVAEVLAEAERLSGPQAFAAFAAMGEWAAARDAQRRPGLVLDTAGRLARSHELDKTRRIVGAAPSVDEVIAALGDDATDIEIEQWLLAWEEAHRSREVSTRRRLALGPSADDERMLLLLPTGAAWEVFAYLGWFGAEGDEAAPLVAVAREWAERWGAVVRLQTGIWMDLVVDRPPTDLDDAFLLARQQQLVAQDTNWTVATGHAEEGVTYSTRVLARDLLGNDRWHLQARP
jgi:hypothetical protein